MCDSFHLKTVFMSRPVFQKRGTMSYLRICQIMGFDINCQLYIYASIRLQNTWNFMLSRLPILTLSLYFVLCTYCYYFTVAIDNLAHFSKNSLCRIPEHSQQNSPLLNMPPSSNRALNCTNKNLYTSLTPSSIHLFQAILITCLHRLCT